MRSFRLSAVLLGALFAVGCGGDGGNGPSNRAPTATFAAPTCNQLVCDFTDGSTDPDGGDDIASLAWTFENGTPATSSAPDPTVTFSAAGTHTVTLTATDNDGLSDDFSLEVTVTGAPGNANPVADFDFICNAQECTFTDRSTDDEGVASWAWNFGDGAFSTEQSPIHTYGNTALQTFSVTLVVTDGDGATNSITQDVAVAPPAETLCENPMNPGEFIPCTLPIEQTAVVTITLTSRDCNADGNTLLITAPIQQTVFTDGCSETVGTVYQINGGTAFNAGTQLEVQVISGSNDPERIAPAIRVSGTFATGWLLEFDDGEDPTGPGEPDFNDLVLTVTATP